MTAAESFPLTKDRWIALVFLGLILASLILSWRSPVARALRRGERIYGVLIGTDFVDYARHSDTLMVVSYDPVSRFLDVLSVPRDTRLHHQGYRFKRINEVYAYVYRKSKSSRQAADAVIAALEETLSVPGSAPLKISVYGQIDYSGFKEIVNIMGGLPITVDEPMHYDDNWGKLHIHFEPGPVWLDGPKALEYVRYRGSSGDRGRIFRQQEFVKILLGRLAHPSLFFRWPQLVMAAWKSVHTNLSWYDMLLVALEARAIQRQNLRFLRLPGKPAGNFWEVDKERTRAMLELMDAPMAATVQEEEAMDPAGITVEVWNASPQNGLAYRVTKVVRQAGFDVVQYGSYPERQPKTLVIDRTGQIRKAQAVAKSLAIGEIVSNIDKKRLVDVTVILGKDFSLEEEMNGDR